MKQILLIACLFLLISQLAFSQGNATLRLEGRTLKGNCNHQFLKGFEIELDTIYDEIDSTLLFSQLPRIGSINFKNKVNIPTLFTLTNRAGFPQIMFKFRAFYLTFDRLKITSKNISFNVDSDPRVPATENDLEIVRLARQMLSEEKYWNKNDDRNCSDDLANQSFSIYCALRIASLEIENEYNHRNAVLQKLRHKIDEKYPNEKWQHRLRDFNNMESITYEDIMALLEEMEQEFVLELNKKTDE